MPPKKAAFQVEGGWKKWDPKKELSPTSINALLAGTERGKTQLMLHLLKLQNPRRVFLTCVSSECYKNWAYLVPFSYCYDRIDEVCIRQYNRLLNFFGQRNIMHLQEVRNIENHLEPICRNKHRLEGEKKKEDLKVEAKRLGWTASQLKATVAEFEKQWAKKGQYDIEQRRASYERKTQELLAPDHWESIWDDVGNQHGAWGLPLFQEDARAARHSGRRFWALAQGILDINPKNRGQFSNAIVHPNMSEADCKRMHKDWMASPNFKLADFQAVLGYFASKGWWMVINRRSQSQDPREFIKLYTYDRDAYVDRYLGCEEYVYYHRLMSSTKRLEEYLNHSVRQHVESKKRADAIAAVGKKRISEKQRREIEASTKVTKQEMKSAFDGLSFVDRIGPKAETDRLREYDRNEYRWFARYLPLLPPGTIPIPPEQLPAAMEH